MKKFFVLGLIMMTVACTSNCGNDEVAAGVSVSTDVCDTVVSTGTEGAVGLQVQEEVKNSN